MVGQALRGHLPYPLERSDHRSERHRLGRSSWTTTRHRHQPSLRVWIEEAKREHTPLGYLHGSQLTDGMAALVAFANSGDWASRFLRTSSRSTREDQACSGPA